MPRGDCLMGKKTEGRKSRDTVPLKFHNANCNHRFVFPQSFHLGANSWFKTRQSFHFGANFRFKTRPNMCTKSSNFYFLFYLRDQTLDSSGLQVSHVTRAEPEPHQFCGGETASRRGSGSEHGIQYWPRLLTFLNCISFLLFPMKFNFNFLNNLILNNLTPIK
jgi:hypothetical protein